MSNYWSQITVEQPCTICGKPDWCSRSLGLAVSVCRRLSAPGGRRKLDRSGAEYWVYGTVKAGLNLLTSSSISVKPPSSLLETDLVYRALLSELRLLPRDARELKKRGLTSELIERNHYRSLPREGRVDLVNKLLEKFGRNVLLRVPGFVVRHSERGAASVRLMGREGLIIPVRDAAGTLVALKIRSSFGAPRYSYMSSAREGGPTPGSPVHVPLHQDDIISRVRLTEGELKADVATSLSAGLTISVAGVTTWRRALPVLAELGAKTCRLAFDMDHSHNIFVARAVREAARNIFAMGIAVELETWPPEFKGIDDCLSAGIEPRVWCGPDAWKQIAAI